jgi:hypothetical protein
MPRVLLIVAAPDTDNVPVKAVLPLTLNEAAVSALSVEAPPTERAL